MFKKIGTYITCAALACASFLGIGASTIKVSADTTPAIGEIVTSTATPTQLGLPSTFTYDWTRSSVDLTQATVTVNGIVYTITNGSIASAAAPSNASSITTIGLMDSIGTKSISQSVYTSMDFSAYTNVKNVVVETTIPSWYCSDLASDLTSAENLIITDASIPLFSWKTNSSLKNIVMAEPLFHSMDGDWSKNSNFDLTDYPSTVKVVTCESLKYGYGKALESFKYNTNYASTVNTTLYVVPDSYFKTTLGVDPTNYAPEEYGGAIWIKSVYDNYSIQGWSIAYIDPAVTKLTIDGNHFSSINPAIGKYGQTLDTVYCKSNAETIGVKGLKLKTLWGPAPSYFHADYYSGVTDDIYFYRKTGVSTITATTSYVGASVTFAYNIHLFNGLTFTNNSSNTAINSIVTTGYSETFTPCIQIKVGTNTESTTTLSMSVEDLKAQLTDRLLEEAEAAEQAAIAAANQAAATAVDNQINNLPATITLNNKTAVQACRTAYNALTTDQKALVTKLSVLTAAEQTIVSLEANAAQVAAYKAAAHDVDVLINKIPSTVSLDDKATVQAARTAYNALSADAKVYVEKYLILEQAETRITTLETEKATRIANAKAKALVVDNLISALPGKIGLSDKAQVEAAREAYTNLTGDEQSYVTKLSVLANCEREIKKLEVAEKKSSSELATIKANAKVVTDMINAFPVSIDKEDQEIVENARIAYNNLSEDEKVFVEGLESLEKAEKTLRDLGVELKSDKEEVKDKIQDSIDKIKEKINSSKGLKALTIVLSIVFGFGLIYVAYVIVRKLVRWFKR